MERCHRVKETTLTHLFVSRFINSLCLIDIPVLRSSCKKKAKSDIMAAFQRLKCVHSKPVGSQVCMGILPCKK